MWIAKARFWVATAVAGAFFMGMSWFMSRQIHRTSAWDRVFTNGQYVGMVPARTDIEASMQRIADGYDVPLSFNKINMVVNKTYAWQGLTTLPTQATAITVNRRPVVYLVTTDDAEKVLHDVKAAYLPKGVSAGTTDIHFLGSVSMSTATVSVTDIFSAKAATRYLLHPGTLHLSARGSSIRSLLPKQAQVQGPLSPALNSTSQGRQSGESHLPLLNVQVKTIAMRTAPVHYQIHYVPDGQLPKGRISVVREGKTGLVKQQVALTYINGQLIKQAVLHSRVLRDPISEVANEGTNSGIASGSWGWPTTYTDITSPFGPRHLDGMGSFHPGVDIGCPIGTPIFATNQGVVEEAGWNAGGYGNWVRINNGNGIETVFGHMSHTVATAGEQVTKGTLIGYSGDTGMATGPHLHYEVRRNGIAISPTPYM